MRRMVLFVCFLFVASPTFAQHGRNKNKKPQLTVNAGPDQTVTFPTSVLLNGTYAVSPSQSVTVSWSKSSGPGIATFSNTHVLAPTATFSLAGTYVLKFTVSASRLSKSDTVTINELSAPLAPVNLAWDAVVDSNLIGYNVYRSETSGVFGATPLNGSTLILGTSYTDSTVQLGHTYYYIVRSVTVYLESSNSNQVSAVR